MNILKKLEGKRSYICAIAGGLTFIASRLGFIDPEMENQIYVLLGFGAVAALRAAK